jgi:hypothetical protein
MSEPTPWIRIPSLCNELGKRWVTRVLAVSVVAAAACTVGTPGPGPPGDPGAVASDAGAADAEGPLDAAGPTGGKDAGPTVPKVSLWALAMGHTWKWNDTSQSSCQPTTSVTGTQDVDNRNAFVETFVNVCNTGPFTTLEVVYPDDSKEYRIGSMWFPIDAPSAGHTWKAGNITYTWRKTGSVTVPYGTFDDCWILGQVTTTQLPGSPPYIAHVDSFVCRGAGVVRMDAYVEGKPPFTFRTLAFKNF